MSRALDIAVARIEAETPASLARQLNRDAAFMVERPHRILIALFPLSGTWSWPHPHMSTVELLTFARTIIRNEPNYIGLPAVRAAEEALVRLLAPGRREASRAA